MVNNVKNLSSFLSSLPLKTAYAHCDIPCGIYDPYPAQIAAHTVIRMTQLIEEAHAESSSAEDQKKLMHAVARYAHVKEEHAEIVKREIRVIWGDYFKEEHIEKFPKLHELVFNIMKHASKARQEVNKEEAKELLELVQEFAEIFWQTKGKKTVKVPSPYPTGGELVIFK